MGKMEPPWMSDIFYGPSLIYSCISEASVQQGKKHGLMKNKLCMLHLNIKRPKYTHLENLPNKTAKSKVLWSQASAKRQKAKL